MAGIDFRLPLSDTSTHKSVNPSLLRIITSNGQQEYDGSTLVEINVSGSSVASAASYSGGSVGSVDRAIYLDSSGVPQQTNPMFVLAKANTVTGITTFNANVIMNSSTTVDDLTAGSLIVNGNTSLVNNTYASTILPHTHNTYDLGSTSLRWKHLYIGSADSYGGTYKPIYWNAGVPQAVSDNSMIVDLESTTSVSIFQASPEPGITGTLGVGHGGTGKTSWTANQLLLATSTSALGQLAAGDTNQVLIQTANGPGWALQSDLSVGIANTLSTDITLKVDLSSSSAVSVNSGSNSSIGVINTLPIGNGGTGKSSWTANRIVVVNGSSALAELTPGSANQLLTQAASGYTWTTPSDLAVATAVSTTGGGTLQVDLNSENAQSYDGTGNVTPGVKNTLGVGHGGTGKSTLTTNGILYASANNAFSFVTAAKKGSILITGSSLAPSWLAPGSSGQILVCKGEAAPEWTTVTDLSAGSAGAYSGGSVGSVNRGIYLDTSGVPQQTNPMFVLANENTVTGVTTFNANVVMNSSVSADSLTAGSLVVQGNTSLVNNTSASTILPHTHNTYDLGSTALRWRKIYVGSQDTYGGTYKPIYWNAGVPQAVSDNSVITDLSSTTSVSIFQSSPSPGITGTLGVGHGGTGKTQWSAKQIVYASDANTLGQLPEGANTAVLMQTTSGPEWKTQDQLTVGQANALTTSITLKVDLQSTSAQAVNSGDNVKLGVEGVLPVAYGGTGKSSWTAGKMVYINSSNAIDELTAGTTNQILAQGANGPTWINQSDISAGSASSLSASPTLQVDLASTSAVNFDGANGATPGVKNTLGVGNGGTGKSSWNKYGVVYASETTTLSDVVAAKKGSILVTTTSQAPTWLAPGNSGYVLQAKGEASPEWVDPSGFSVSEAASYSGGAVGDEDTAIYIDSSGVPNACNAMLVLDNDNSVTGSNTFSGQNIFTNVTKFNANVQLNSSTTADSLIAGSLVVSGNTSLVNTTTTGHLLPHTDSTYNIGSDANRYANIYADTLYGSGSNITSLDASNISSGTLSADRLATSGATAGGYGDTSNQTPGHGSAFKVPYVKVDNKGRVTEISEHTVTLPGSGNTHYTTYLYATTDSGTSGITNVTNGNVHLRLFDDTTARSTIKIYGSGAVSVTTDANGAIKIDATNSRDAGYGKITPDGDTGTNAVTANTTQITAKSYNEAFTFKTGNKWLTIAGTESTTAGSDILTIGHAVVTVTTTNAPDDNQQNPGYGSTFKIPKITVDGAGHVTEIGSTLVKIPATDQSDYRVQQDGNNENKEFPILLKNTNNYTNETASTTKFVNTSTKAVDVNPNSGRLSAAEFRVDKNVTLHYDAATASLQFIFG